MTSKRRIQSSNIAMRTRTNKHINTIKDKQFDSSVQ